MKYLNASEILPDALLKELQKYAEGEALYIPKRDERKKWGEGSGARSFYEKRNAEIKSDYANGMSFEQLADKYALSVEIIRKLF